MLWSQELDLLKLLIKVSSFPILEAQKCKTVEEVSIGYMCRAHVPGSSGMNIRASCRDCHLTEARFL